MLVIRRRAGEGLLIGTDIQIEILEVSPTRVKIGIVAPSALPIVRKEVVLTRQENLAASSNAPPHTIAWLSAKLSSTELPPPADARIIDGRHEIDGCHEVGV
jgi:carbon storage regulator